LQQITKNVYVETEFQGCNTSFVVTGEGVVVIDTPMVPAEARKWNDEAGRHGVVRYVINTEPHTDHVAGNCYFEGTGVSHEGTRQAILSAKVDDLKGMLQWMAPDALPLEEGFHYRPPEITFSQRLTLYPGEHTFQLIHMPGHSPYQLAVYVPQERVVFTSDNVSVGMPFFRQAVPFAWLDSLQELQKLDVDKVVPGHGNVCEKSYIPQMSVIIEDWIDAVKKAIDQGMSSEEAQEKISLADKYPELAQNERMAGMIRTNIAALYNTLKK
jgi:cyclase